MNAAPLIAMNAPTVLTIIHWIGVGFIFLWFLGSCMRDGMWNNGLRCFNAFVAVMISFPVATLVGIVIRMAAGALDDVYMVAAIAIGGAWIVFILCLAVMQTITDKLSQVKVPFHPIVNGIGSFILICGITFVLLSMCMPALGLVLATK
jgi:hypothetical protein